MLLSLPKPLSLLAFRRHFITFFELLLFLFFFTLHADQLSVSKAGFSIRLNNFIALFLGLFFLIRFKSKIFSFDKKFLLGLGFLTLSILSSLALSSYKSRCLFFFIWYAITVLGYLLLPYLFIFYFSEVKVFKLYFFAFICVGLYAFLQLLLSYAGIQDPFIGQTIGKKVARPNAFAYEPSYYALYMTPFVMMANLHFLLDKKRHFFIFAKLKITHIVFINFLFLVSTTTSSLFSYFVFICLLPFIKVIPKKLVWKVFGALLASMATFTALFPSFAKRYFMKFFFDGFSHYSFYERWSGIVNCWQTFLKNPFFGVGLGGVPPYLFQAWQSREDGFLFLWHDALIVRAVNPFKIFEPSNVFTEVLASLGILGILGFSVFLYGYGSLAAKALKTKDDERRHFCLLFLISTFVMIVVLQFNQGLMRTYIWAHLGITCAYFVQTIRLSQEATLQEGQLKNQVESF